MDEASIKSAVTSLSRPHQPVPTLDLAGIEATIRRRRRRIQLAVTLAVTAAVVVAFAGSALLRPSEVSLEGLPFARSASEATDGPGVRRLADQVYASFAGTERQRNAGWVLRSYGQNHAMDECMDHAGFPEWDWSLSRVYASPVDPLAPGVWFAEPNRPRRSAYLMSQQRRWLAENEMNRARIPADQNRAVGDCLTSITPGGTGADAGVAAVSETAARLEDEWDDMVRDVAGSAADTDDYYSCMDTTQIPLLGDGDQPATDVDKRLASLGPDEELIPVSPSDPLADNQEWRNFLAQEKAVTDADWSCRQRVYEEHVTDLVPAIAEFADDHRDEILRNHATWAEIQERAQAVGYTGQDGPLGG